MTFLSLFALRFRRSTDVFFDTAVLRPYLPFCLGLSMGVFYYVILNIVAHMAIPILFILVLALGSYGYILSIRKQKWNAQTGLLFFGVGFYAQTLVIPLIFVPTAVNIITALIAYTILAVSFWWLQKHQHVAPSSF